MRLRASQSFVSRHRAILIAVGLLLGACQAGEEAPMTQETSFATSHSALHGRFAHVAITARPMAGQAAYAVMDVSAQFVDFQGIDPSSVRRSLDLWSPDLVRPEEQCDLRLIRGDIGSDWFGSRIELMHAGVLNLETELEDVSLSPRTMPELLPYLSGVIYGTHGSEAPEYTPDGLIEFWTDGGDDVNAFSVDLSLPAPIQVSYVSDVAVGSADAINLDLSTDLVLLWSPSPSQGDEVVYIELHEDVPSPSATLSCTAFDDGAFAISELALEALQSGESAPLRLIVRRARAVDLDLSAFDAAEAIAIAEHSLILY